MRRLLCTCLIMSLLMLSGCTKASQPTSDEALIQETIKQYNNTLQLALKSDAKILKDVATEREIGRVDIFINQMAEEHKLVDAQLKKLKITALKNLTKSDWQALIERYDQEHQMDLRVPAAGALKLYESGVQVNTEELWSYQYLDLVSKQSINKPEKLGYDVTYIVVKEDNKWKITEVTFKEKALNP